VRLQDGETAMIDITSSNSNPGAGGPLSAPDVVDTPQLSRQEPALLPDASDGAGSLSFLMLPSPFLDSVANSTAAPEPAASPSSAPSDAAEPFISSALEPAMAAESATAPGLTDPPVAVAEANTPEASGTARKAPSGSLFGEPSRISDRASLSLPVDPELEAAVSALEAGWRAQMVSADPGPAGFDFPTFPTFLNRRNSKTFRVVAINDSALNAVSKFISSGVE
jgi:hypothetical protein